MEEVLKEAARETEETPFLQYKAAIPDKTIQSTYTYLYRRSLIIYGICFALGLISTVINIATGNHDLIIYSAMIACIGLLSFVVFNKISLKKLVKHYRFVNGRALCLDFYQASVKAYGEKNSTSYDYDNILKAVERPDKWLIYFGEKKAYSVLFIPKEGFTDDGQYGLFTEKVIGRLAPDKVKRVKSK